MKIAVFGRKFDAKFENYLNTFLEETSILQASVYFFEPFYEAISSQSEIKFSISGFFNTEIEITTDFNYIFSFGGDGTFLETVNLVRDKNIPIIGINTGRLGFLANISKEEIKESVHKIFNNEFYVEERRLIQFSSENKQFGEFPFALNEVSVQKKGTTMITVHVYVGSRFLNSYWTDGLIISTPTGSTAYSLSVGGPIVSPDCNVFIISPIASHNLSVRPIVINDDNEIRLVIESRDQTFLATLDSQHIELSQGTEIKLKLAPFSIKMIQIEENNFYNTIRNKLLWGIDKRN